MYAGASGVLVVVAALLAGLAFEPPARTGIWSALAAAWLVQALAFGVLLAMARRRATLVVAGWTVGIFLRLGALAAVAWLTLAGVLALPAEATLLALVVALFILLLLEPVFFRYRVGAS